MGVKEKMGVTKKHQSIFFFSNIVFKTKKVGVKIKQLAKKTKKLKKK